MEIYLIGAGRPFLEHIQSHLGGAEIKDTNIYVGNNMTPEDFADNLKECEILVTSPSAFTHFTREHMEALPNLKFITTTSVGVDWVDLDAATELDIIVSNQKGVNAQSVAEHCMGMMFSLSKRITETDRNMRTSLELQKKNYEGVELTGKTLGIIGLGDIGTRVAKFGNVIFGRVLGLNRTKFVSDDVEYADIETIMKESDVVVVSVPLNEQTENMLSSNEIAMMKPGAFLVSIAREKVIDKNAVIEAISSGRLGGFALDADIAVPLPLDDPYFKHDQIVVTPHSASMTKESYERYASMTVENIQAFLSDNPIRVVNDMRSD